MTRPLALLVFCAALGASHPAASLADEPPSAGSDEPPSPPPPLGAPPAALPPAAPPAEPAPPPLITPSTGAPEETSAPDEPPRPRPGVEPSEPRASRFGDQGQMVLTGALSASLGHLGYSSGGSSLTSFSVQPAFDYFSFAGFSQGASVFLRYSDSTSGINISNRNVTFGANVQVGRNLWIGDRVSFWPRLEMGVWQSRSTFGGVSGGSVSVDGAPISLGTTSSVVEDAVFVQLFAPFLFHPASHFFLGIGPDGYVDVFHTAGSISNRRTFLGVSSTVGGWF